jgi:hypothetical protein
MGGGVKKMSKNSVTSIMDDPKGCRRLNDILVVSARFLTNSILQL